MVSNAFYSESSELNVGYECILIYLIQWNVASKTKNFQNKRQFFVYFCFKDERKKL